MGSPTYEIEVQAVDGPVVRLKVTAANHCDQPIPTERRFPFLVAAEAYQAMAGRLRFAPDGWTLPSGVDARALTAEHPYAEALSDYSTDDVWIDEEMEERFHHDHLIAHVSVENLGTFVPEGEGVDPAFDARPTGEVVCRFTDAALARHLVAGARWYISWW